VALVIALVGSGVAPRALVDSRFAVSEAILRQRQERMLEKKAPGVLMNAVTLH